MHLQNIIQAAHQFLRCDRSDPHMDYQNARELLWDLPCTLQNIQEMIDSVSLFSQYGPSRFCEYGIFLSEMIRKAAKDGETLTFDTHNLNVVHSPLLYQESKLGFYPDWEALNKFEHKNLLISNFASNLGKSINLAIKGNLGHSFACYNYGAYITLEGELSTGGCWGIRGGVISIKGIAGHEFARYGKAGIIHVDGEIRSFAGLNYEPLNYQIYLNQKLLPKDLDSLRKVVAMTS